MTALLTALFLLAISTVALLPHPGHDDPASPVCAVCQAGHLPFINPGAVVEVEPPTAVASEVVSADPRSESRLILTTEPSRAPPA